MAPNLLDAAATVQAAARLPTSRKGALLPSTPHSYGNDLGVPSWSVWEAQARTVPVDALRWPQINFTADDMRRDSQIQGLLNSVFLPIRHMDWYVDPNGASDTLVQEVCEDFGLPLDGEESDEDGDGLDHDEHLRLALLCLAYGNRFFEEDGVIEGEGAGQKYRLRALLDRDPHSVQRIDFNDNGLVSIRVPASEQEQTLTGLGYVDLSADRVLDYVWDREGGNWAGRPLLYGIYRAWLLKDELVRGDSVTKRRFGGLYVAEATIPDVTPEVMAEAAQLAMLARSGDMAGVAMPYGTRLNLVGVSGSIPDGIESARYHDEQMARAFMQMFAELGKVGSRALGETLMDHHGLAILAVAKFIRKQQMRLVRRIAIRNYGPNPGPLPQIRFRHDEHQPLGAAELVSLIEAGAVVVDDKLEATIREQAGLPAREGAGRALPSKAPATAGRRKPTTATTEPKQTSRSLSPLEKAAGFDLALQQSQQETGTDSLVTAWASIHAQQIEALTEQAKNVTTPAEAATLAAPVLGAATIAATMSVLAQQGIASALAEAEHQGVELPAPDLGQLTTDVLVPRAEAVAVQLASSLSQAAINQTLAQFSAPTAASGDDLAELVNRALDKLSEATLREHLGAAVHAARNQGRFHTMEGWGDQGVAYASELADLDNGKPDPKCCDACRDVDGSDYESLAAARLDYPVAGFLGCEGRGRCRGSIVTVSREVADEFGDAFDI